MISVPLFLAPSGIMRLLAELVIIAPLLYFVWNKVFKEQIVQAPVALLHQLGFNNGSLEFACHIGLLFDRDFRKERKR